MWLEDPDADIVDQESRIRNRELQEGVGVLAAIVVLCRTRV